MQEKRDRFVGAYMTRREASRLDAWRKPLGLSRSVALRESVRRMVADKRNQPQPAPEVRHDEP